jgi:hypothetical protein
MACRRTFDAIMAREDASLAEDADTSHYVPLSESIPFTPFLELKTRAIRKAIRIARESGWSPNSVITSAPWPTLSYRPVPTEFKLVDSSLRLVGRADVLEEVPEKTTIRDYKTGRVHGRDGRIAAQIALQLRLYGLLALARRPGIRVELFVEHVDSEQVSFEEDDVRETRAYLRTLMSSLPVGANVDACGLASVGGHCKFCEWRHVCPSYRSVAPSMWPEPSAAQILAFDTWGTITTAEHTSSDAWSVRLRDAAQRIVTISELHGRWWELRDLVGQPCFFFGLEPRGDTRTAAGAFLHPTNFRELAGPGERRADGLCVFSG